MTSLVTKTNTMFLLHIKKMWKTVYNTMAYLSLKC